MLTRSLLALLFVLTSFPLLGQATLSGPEFDAATQGKTFHFSVEGEDYGGEQYLPGQVVLWSFLDGQRWRGQWYQSDQNICFVYEDDPEPSCWRFFGGSDGLSAQFADAVDDNRVYSAQPVEGPLYCLGPEVGV